MNLRLVVGTRTDQSPISVVWSMILMINIYYIIINIYYIIYEIILQYLERILFEHQFCFGMITSGQFQCILGFLWVGDWFHNLTWVVMFNIWFVHFTSMCLPGPLCEHHDQAAGKDEQDSAHKKERLVHQGEDEGKVGLVQVTRLHMWPHNVLKPFYQHIWFSHAISYQAQKPYKIQATYGG
jgi:hypothetical protein